MEISIYFEPFNDESILESLPDDRKGRLIHNIDGYSKDKAFPDYKSADIAILGVSEDRQAFNNPGCKDAPDYIRYYLYQLFQGPYKCKIADLGNIRQGNTVDDTFFALKSVMAELISSNVLPIVIGGSQDLTYAMYLAYAELGRIINISAVDSHFDIGKTEESFTSRSYLSKIILHQPNYMFNFTNIGFQTYFVEQEAVELMSKLYFDTYRLGVVRSDMESVEPIVRNADMLSFDIGAIRKSDAPSNKNAPPNGFYGEEACQICRYAGMSDKMTSAGFFEVNPEVAGNEQTSHLLAQMIWYFIDGFYNRKFEFPIKNKKDFIKYRVTMKSTIDEMVFYKSKKSDRWWMNVPCPRNLQSRYERHHLVPCSLKDYQTACRNEIPETWWQVYQKLI